MLAIRVKEHSVMQVAHLLILRQSELSDGHSGLGKFNIEVQALTFTDQTSPIVPGHT